MTEALVYGLTLLLTLICIVWMTLLPAIGFLYLVGFLP